MEMRKLQELVVSALEDIKGRNIEVINTTGLSSLFDSMIIATGDSNRQVRALARNVEERPARRGSRYCRSKARRAASGCWWTSAT